MVQIFLLFSLYISTRSFTIQCLISLFFTTRQSRIPFGSEYHIRSDLVTHFSAFISSATLLSTSFGSTFHIHILILMATMPQMPCPYNNDARSSFMDRSPYSHFPSFLIASPPSATHSSLMFLFIHVFLCVSVHPLSIFIHCSIVYLFYSTWNIS
eukprot:196905_1